MKTDTIIVGLGDIAASKEAGTIIKTMALGSCVGVIAIAPKQRAVGMVHVVLPQAQIDPEKAKSKPGYFADTGIEALFAQFRQFRVLDHRELMIKIVGGASIMDRNNTFNIGKRNLLQVRKVLWKMQLAAIAEDVGGNISRTVWVEVDTGRVFVSSPGRGRWEL